MTLREILNERSFADEEQDKKHPIQKDVEIKLTKLVYDNIIKDKIRVFENKYHILDKTYDEVAALIPEGKYAKLRDDDFSVEMQKVNYPEDGIEIGVHCSWETEEPEDKDRYHTIKPGDTWRVTLRKKNWDADKETYKKFINGDIPTLIKSKAGVGRWNLYKGQAFWLGDKGFRLTDDYKIVDNTEDDYKNYQNYSAKMIAEWFWTHYGPNYSKAVNNVHTQAFNKFNNSNEFAAWIDEKPSRREKLSGLMETVLGKRRW